MSTFGERLRSERIRLGLSQEEFGALAAVKRGAQVNYEKDERSPDAEYLQALVPHGVDVLFLIADVRSSPGPRLSGDQAELLQDFDRLSAELQKAARLMLRTLAKACG